jgi:hypothetical protein
VTTIERISLYPPDTLAIAVHGPVEVTVSHRPSGAQVAASHRSSRHDNLRWAIEALGALPTYRAWRAACHEAGA